jgi:hypothetical protein
MPPGPRDHALELDAVVAWRDNGGMDRITTSTLLFAAALFAAPSSFACGDEDDMKDDKDESFLSVGAPGAPSCGDEDDKKDDKDESFLSVGAPEAPSCGDEDDKKDDKDES